MAQEWRCVPAVCRGGFLITDEQLADIEAKANNLAQWTESDMQENPTGHNLAFRDFMITVNEDVVLAMCAELRRMRSAMRLLDNPRLTKERIGAIVYDALYEAVIFG